MKLGEGAPDRGRCMCKGPEVGGVYALLWRNKGRAVREDRETWPALGRAGLCEGSQKP